MTAMFYTKHVQFKRPSSIITGSRPVPCPCNLEHRQASHRREKRKKLRASVGVQIYSVFSLDPGTKNQDSELINGWQAGDLRLQNKQVCMQFATHIYSICVHGVTDRPGHSPQH
ncbi:hypothetical protein Mapa_016548 [Marchantia paleacea]|nr:hypothetical protein Mapa_016548 [Marchantia paleacea]